MNNKIPCEEFFPPCRIVLARCVPLLTPGSNRRAPLCPLTDFSRSKRIIYRGKICVVIFVDMSGEKAYKIQIII